MLLMTFTDYPTWRTKVNALVNPDVYIREYSGYFEAGVLAAGAGLRFVSTGKPATFDVNFPLATTADGMSW